jgi:hypothetical protein
VSGQLLRPVALVVVISLAACSGGGASSEEGSGRRARTIDAGNGVTIVAPEGSLDARALVTARAATAVPAEAPPGFVPASPPVALNISGGSLHGPVSVRFPVAPAVLADIPADAGRNVPVIHVHGNEHPDLVLGTLDRNAGVITVQTNEFSIFSPLVASTQQLASKVGEIANGFFGDLFPQVATVACTDESGARADGWSIASSDGPTVRWCFGRTGDERELRVANGRRYALSFALSDNIGVVGDAPLTISTGVSRALDDALGAHTVVVGPGALATLVPKLATDGIATVHASYDGLAQSISTLQLAAELLAAIAARLPGSSKGAQAALDAIDAGQCAPKLLELAADVTSASKVGAMVAACLNPNALVSGAAAVLLAGTLATISSVIAFFITSAQALFDQVRGQSDYTIAVSRTSLTESQILNSSVPAGVCGDDSVGWKQPNPIQLTNGQGESRNASGAATGPSIHPAKIVGQADFDGDGRRDFLISVYCSGGTIADCCAGRSSHAQYAYAVTAGPDGEPRMIGDVLRAGSSLPGDRYGPAARDIREITIDAQGQVVTREHIYYPEQYTSAQVGGVDPSADVVVVHTLRGGHWQAQ